jgi:hypothetical protein
MKKLLIALATTLLLVAGVVAISQPFSYQGKDYYVVTSTYPSEDTGDEVCAKVGKGCVGYTAYTDDVCDYFHPGASVTSNLDGDVSGVYCNGPPQTGVCAGKYDTCHTCPQCSAGVDCSTPIGGLYREMYVECEENIKPLFYDLFVNIWSFISRIFSIFARPEIIVHEVQVGPYPDKWVCDFYQTPWPGVNKKLVSCERCLGLQMSSA